MYSELPFIPPSNHEGRMNGTFEMQEIGKTDDNEEVVSQKKSNTYLYRYCQIFLAEFVATSLLMVMVCLGCLKLTSDPISPLQSSLASGFAIATLVQIPKTSVPVSSIFQQTGFLPLFLFLFIAIVSTNGLIPETTVNSITVFDLPPNSLEPMQKAVLLGTANISFAPISDCHMNPAVTALFFSLGKIDVITSMIYVFAELTGATAGYGILWALTPTKIKDLNPGHCETVIHSSLSSMNGAFIELIISSLLMFMICACLDQRNTHNQDSVPIKFGLAIATISLCAGTLTGASMNPARSFGPAIWHRQWTDHWIYWIAPITAGFIIPKVYIYFFQKDLTVNSLN